MLISFTVNEKKAEANVNPTDRLSDVLRDTKAILENTGLVEGTSSRPQSLVIERAFVG